MWEEERITGGSPRPGVGRQSRTMNASSTERQFWDDRNDTFNLSFFDDEIWVRASPVKFATVLLSLVLSTTNNGVLVFVFLRAYLKKGSQETAADWKNSARIVVVDVMVIAVAIVALARDLSGHTAQIIKMVDDDYEQSVITCRLQAFANHVFRYLFFMYLALFYVERFVRHWRSEEHSLTFPVITIKVILCGLLLVVTSQMTGPLYGWGNYDYVPETWSCELDLLSPWSCSFVTVVNSFLFVPAWLAMTATNLAFLKGDPSECMDSRERSRCTSAVLKDKKVKFLLCFTWTGVSLLSWPRALLETLVSCRATPYPSPEVLFWTRILETETSLVFPFGILISSVSVRRDFEKQWRQRHK